MWNKITNGNASGTVVCKIRPRYREANLFQSLVHPTVGRPERLRNLELGFAWLGSLTDGPSPPLIQATKSPCEARFNLASFLFYSSKSGGSTRNEFEKAAHGKTAGAGTDIQRHSGDAPEVQRFSVGDSNQ